MKSQKAKLPKESNPVEVSKVELENIVYDQLIQEAQSWNKRDDEFEIKEFIKDTGMKYKTAQRYLDEKISVGIIADRKVGTSRYYRIVNVEK